MDFKDDLQNHITILEQLPDFSKDMALRRVVELLKGVKSKGELQQQKSLISRISIDSIESWDTVNLISSFLASHTK